MRHDAQREDTDAAGLREEGHRLDREAVRLWRLAAAIDPQAQKDLLERIRRCCKSSGLELLRAEIVRLAHELGIEKIPE